MIIIWAVVFLLEICLAQEYCLESPDLGILRPCPAQDLDCLRTFSARYSSCQPVNVPPGDLYLLGELVLPLPGANASFIWENTHVRGLGSPILEDFYVNTITNKIVIYLRYDQVSAYSPTTSLRYYFEGREPVVLTDYFSIMYKDFTMTAIIPFDRINGIRWGERDLYTYYRNPNIPFNYGPGLVSGDPQIQAAFYKVTGDNNNFIRTLKEMSVDKGQEGFDNYFTRYVCNYLV